MTSTTFESIVQAQHQEAEKTKRQTRSDRHIDAIEHYKNNAFKPIYEIVGMDASAYDFKLAVAVSELKKANIMYQQPSKAHFAKLEMRRRKGAVLRVVGERLLCIRLSLGLTQVDVAIASGVNAATIGNLEQGHGGSISTLLLVADALMIPLSLLLEGTGKLDGQYTSMLGY